MWDPGHRYDIERELFLDLLARSLHELPPDTDQEEGLLLADEWESDRAQAELVIRLFNQDAEFRRRREEEVRTLRGGPDGAGGTAGAEPAGPSSTARDLAGWAMAVNSVVTEKPPGAAVVFQPRGKVRLVKQVARHGRLLELYRQQRQWQSFLDYAASLAVGIREGVFHSHGRETAAELLLCLLAHTGFRRNETSFDPSILHSALRDGDVRQIAHLFGKTFDRP